MGKLRNPVRFVGPQGAREPLADKTSRLIAMALSRAAFEPEGFPLFSTKSEEGLFANTAPARLAAEKCRTEGLLEIFTETRGRQTREMARLTQAGQLYLCQSTNTREVLEDFLRAIEGRESQLQDLIEQTQKLSQSFAGVREVLLKLSQTTHSTNGNKTMTKGLAIPERPRASSASDELIADIKARLAEWHAQPRSGEDYPLPMLYRSLEQAGRVSIGAFHDALRQLHDDNLIYLHPWTAPLYTLPEPAFALLVGHEVAYYASIR